MDGLCLTANFARQLSFFALRRLLDVLQSLAKVHRQRMLDLLRDQSHHIETLYMPLIFETEAREFHNEQLQQPEVLNAIRRTVKAGGTQVGRCMGIFFANLFPAPDDMHPIGELWLLNIWQERVKPHYFSIPV